MTPFFAGMALGALFTGCALALFLTHKPRREPIDWQERAYHPPVVTLTSHQSINRIREINL